MCGRRRREGPSLLSLLAAQFLLFLFHAGGDSSGLGAIVAAEEVSLSDYSSSGVGEGFGPSANTTDQETSDIPSTSFPQDEERGEEASSFDQEKLDISSTSISERDESGTVTGTTNQQTFEIQSTNLPGDEEGGEESDVSNQQTSDVQLTSLPGDVEDREESDVSNQQTSEILSTSFPTSGMPSTTDQQTSDIQSTSPMITIDDIPSWLTVNMRPLTSAITSTSRPLDVVQRQMEEAYRQMAGRINGISQQAAKIPSMFLDPLAQVTLLMKSHSLSLTAEQHFQARICCKSGSTSCPEGCTVDKSNEFQSKKNTDKNTETFPSKSTTPAEA